MPVQIREVSLRRILVPLEEPTIWIGGADAAWSRTVLRMRTVEGFEGIAETSGNDPDLRAASRTETAVHRKVTVRPSAHFGDPVGAAGGAPGKSGKHAVQALETACWDIIRKALQHLRRLLGGKLRSTVPMIAYVQHTSSARSGQPTLTTSQPGEVLGVLQPVLSSSTDSRPSRSKGAFSRRRRSAAMRGPRCLPPPGAALRIRTRSGGGQEPHIRIGHEFEELSLALVRGSGLGNRGHATHSPRRPHPLFATNMCCLQLDQLLGAIRAHTFDVELLEH